MAAESGQFTVTGVGDAIIARKLRSFDHEGFRETVSHLREADAAMVNLETLLHDYDGYPTGVTTGTYMRSPPWVADELTWAGFNLVAAATNHSFDYSHGGMESTMRELEARELGYAGLGENLASARAPVYVDTPAGRVALVAACSSIRAGSIAGEQRRDMQGRPGISPLRHDARYVVPEEDYESVKRLSENLDLEELKEHGATSSFPYLYPLDPEDGFTFPNVGGGDMTFVPGEEYRVERTVDQDDVDAIARSIEEATEQADWVIASLHAHEGANGRSMISDSAAFAESFARTCINAGADVFFGHGPHVLQGVEVYDGAPIFHSLGNFVFQNQLITHLPAEMYERYGVDDPEATPADVFERREYDEDGNRIGFLENDENWESILPVCRFEDGDLVSVTIHPLDLRRDEPRSSRGRPIVPDEDRGEEILDRLADMSRSYGTSMTVEDGSATVEL